MKNINWIVMSTGVIFFSACGEGSNSVGVASTVKLEMVNGQAVPVVDQATVKASVKGIDSNSNGVRDEVEYATAALYGSIASAFDPALGYARKLQVSLVSPDLPQDQARAMILAEVKAFDCLKSKVGVAKALEIAAELELRTFNTVERGTAREASMRASGLMEIPDAAGESC